MAKAELLQHESNESFLSKAMAVWRGRVNYYDPELDTIVKDPLITLKNLTRSLIAMGAGFAIIITDAETAHDGLLSASGLVGGMAFAVESIHQYITGNARD